MSATVIGRRTVALVEDDEDIRELTQMLLASEGYEVLAFAEGTTALRHCLASPPDLVVLDCMLPGLSGLGVLRMLRAHRGTRGVPVVVVSAFSEPSNVEAARRAGAQDFLAKPFGRAQLAAVVRTQLDAAAWARDERRLVSA